MGPKTYPVMEKDPWTTKHNVYSVADEYNSLQMSVKSNESLMSLNSDDSVFVFDCISVFLLLSEGWGPYVTNCYCVELNLCVYLQQCLWN